MTTTTDEHETMGIHHLDELMYEIEAVAKESEHEQGMRELALERWEMRQAKAIKAGRASTTEPLKGAIPALLEATTRLLEQRMEPATKPGVVRRGLAIMKDVDLSVEEAAMIGIRTVLDGVASGLRLSTVAGLIGGRLEDGARCNQLAKREPLLFKRMEQDMKESGSQDLEFRRKALKRAIDKAYSEEEWVKWTPEERTYVGLEVADALCQHGLVYKAMVPLKRKGKPYRETFILLTPEAEAALAERTELVKAALKPWFKPMLHEPLPWSPHVDGGYTACDVPLVKTYSRQHLETMRQADMPAVYTTINALQATPWRVNEDVWFVAQHLFDAGQGEAGLPQRETTEPPVRPSEIPPPGEPLSDYEKELLGEWKAKKRDWHSDEGKRRSKATQCMQMLSVADEMRKFRRFFFPYQLDYRGRVYPVPLQLNPQGNDLSKGMLTFAEGKPLGEMGGYWLAVHGANTWANEGIDKAPMNDRVDWVVEHEEQILAVAEDPLENRWWTEADGGNTPWQFLAFCLEWAAYVESGESPEFVSYLPVGKDGSCNGLQHFSAMLRDPVGAQATNLVDADVPNDIYSQVASRVEGKLRDRLKSAPAADRELIGLWLEHGVTRALVKQPVMTTPYGVTRSGMRKQLHVALAKRPSKVLDTKARAKESWQAVNYITPLVDEAISEIVSASREAMDFLRAFSGACMDAGRDPWWTTPSGFPVWQRIFEDSKRRIKSKLLGNTRITLSVPTKKRSRRKHGAALPPNFVHSLDAAHMTLTVAALEEEGPHCWAMVHDSFGTHAGSIERMDRVLREQFVAMYANGNPLEQLVEGMGFPEGVEIPELPAEGDFDVSGVLEAEFFFA